MPWFDSRMARWSLLAIVAALYAPCLGAPFVFDDAACIQSVPPLGRLRDPRGFFTTPAEGMTTDGRPLLMLTLAVNRACLGDRPAAFRAVNVAIHALAAWLLFRILAHAFGRGPFAPQARMLAWWAALLWAVHPIHTASVTYVVQRAESLCGLLYLAVLDAWIRGRPRLAVLWCLLGMATKEVMVTAPLAVLAYDACFMGAGLRETWRRRRWAWLALAATWVVLACCVGWGHQTAGAGFTHRFSSLAYARSECGVLLHYLRLCFLPLPLTLDYGWPLSTGWDGAALSAVAGVAVLLLGVAWGGLGRSRLAFLGFWFFLLLAPTSSLMPIQDLAFEHRTYLASASVAVLVAWGGWRAMARFGPRAWMAGCAVTVLLMASLAWARNGDYASHQGLWADAARKRPGNPRPHFWLAGFRHEAGDLRGARRHYGRVIALGANGFLVNLRLGLVSGQLGDAEAAVRHLRRAAALRPADAGVHYYLGVSECARRDLPRAVRAFGRAARLRPGDARILAALEQARRELGQRVPDGVHKGP